MQIIVTGVSHKTSPISIREQFYLRSSERELLLSELKNDPAVFEAIVLSTCNRTEIYAHVLDDKKTDLVSHLFKVRKISDKALYKQLYLMKNKEAVSHFLRVTCGLDSLVLGEQQILGQVKSAVETSRQQGMLGKEFNILSNLVIRAGKKAQSETQISYGGASISWAAVSRAKGLLGSLQDKSILIIGTGKMGELAAEYLHKEGVGSIYVMNRTREKAVGMAKKFKGHVVSFWDLKDVLRKVDICICSAGAPHYLIEKEAVEEIFTDIEPRKLLMIDISIPRNINPNVSQVQGISLIGIDDLDKVVEENISKRYEAVGEVEDIIKKKLDEFYIKLEKAGPFQTADRI